MTRNVETIRQAITKVTQMLSGMDIQVTQRGDQAKVTYHPKTGKAQRVNIPYLPDGASDQLIEAVQGFLDHEVAHVLYSDPAALVEAGKEGKRLAVTHNIFEDCYIERNMTKRFKGSGLNLGNVRKLVFDTRNRPVIDELINHGMTDELTMFKALSVTMFRALAGQQECKDFMDDGDKWQYMPNVLKAVSFFPTEIEKCRSSWDTLELARKALKALEDMNDEDEDEDDDQDDQDDDQNDDGEEGDEEGDGKGKSQKKPKDPKGEDEDEDEDEGEGDDNDGSGSEGEDDDAEDESESGSSDDGEDDDGDDESDGDGSDDGEDEDADGNDKGDDNDGSDDGDDEGDSNDGDEDGEDQSSSKGDDGDDGDDGQQQDDSEKQDTELFLDAMESAQDFESELSAEVTKVYQDQNASGQFGEWIIFSREYDEPTVYDATGCPSDAVTTMNDEVNSMVGPMAKQLERLILARKRSMFEPGKRSGRLHSANLHRLQSGDDRIFRRKFETKIKDTAVEILTDMSGSMSGGKMTTAAYSSYALAQMLQRVNIPCEVMTFTTGSGDSQYNKEMQEAMQRLGRPFSHMGVCQHKLLKGFNERIDSNVAKRFAHLGEGHGNRWMGANCDPESVYTAGVRLAKRPEERKILMVLSDGHPAFAGDGGAGYDRLRDVVKDCEGAGMDVLGIGIQDSSVREFYPKCVVIQRATDLPATIMGEMQGLLLKG